MEALLQESLPTVGQNHDLRLNIKKESLYINGSDNVCWVQEELKVTGQLPSINLTDTENAWAYVGTKAKNDSAKISVQKAEITSDLKKVIGNSRQDEKEKEELLIPGNTQTFEEDTCGPVALVALLKACGARKDLRRGSRIHTAVAKRGLLQKNVFVGSAVIHMYAKCGALAKAQEVFDALPIQNVVSWNTLIAGYVQHKCNEEALNCFERMQDEGVFPDKVTFSCILKACGSIEASDKGQEVHSQVVKEGLLDKCVVTGNALIDMYVKCGLLGKAQEVFDELPMWDVITWTALITGYALHGHGEKALKCYERMQHEGGSPNAATFLGILKACSSIRAAHKGQEVHAEIISDGLLEKDMVVGTTLVDMYAKCGMLAEAQDVFDELPVRDAWLWSTLIDGYAQNMQGEEALNRFEQMQLAGFFPDEITFACVLKACGSLGAADKGKELHNQLVRDKVLGKDAVVVNALIGMYAKCGLFEKASEVFNEMPNRDLISWNALISGYVQHGYGEEAFTLFARMQAEGLCPDAITSVYLLKACGSLGDLDKGQEFHAIVVREGLLENDIVVMNALIDMYVKCGRLEKAEDVFDQLQIRDAFSWNALIAGHAQHVHGEKALNCFHQMQLEGLPADPVTFASVLKACASIGAVEKGQEIHDQILRNGVMEKSLIVSNSLIDMYAKCGLLGKAQEVFDKLLVRDVVSWNVLIAGYAQHGCVEEALNYFEQMQLAGLSADSVTFVCLLKACSSIRAADKGQEVHAHISKDGSLEEDVIVGTALVDMYAKCGLIEKAQEVFDKLPHRDVVTWNALVTGYAQHALGEEALDCFEQMQKEGIVPDVVTFVCILKACGSIGAACKGQEMHAEIVRRGQLEKDATVGCALVDMYANCGMSMEAQESFDTLSVFDVAHWNALIAGYALLGKDEHTFNLLDEMVGKGVNPDLVTFTTVLNTCCHGGLLEKGQMYFELMSLGVGIIPTLKHHTCIVDLFARAGQLENAAAVIQKLPIRTDVTLWRALLGACQSLRNMKLGTWAFKHASQLDVKDASTYVSLSNIYAVAHKVEDANESKTMRKEEQAWKNPERSWWIDANGIVSMFSDGDNRHPQREAILAKVECIAHRMSQEGYTSGLHCVTTKGTSNDKVEKDGLYRHSEKLAIACALINTPEGTPVHVFKDTRSCGACHLATSFVSKIEKRKIFIRDASRLHIFEDGKCACCE